LLVKKLSSSILFFIETTIWHGCKSYLAFSQLQHFLRSIQNRFREHYLAVECGSLFFQTKSIYFRSGTSKDKWGFYAKAPCGRPIDAVVRISPIRKKSLVRFPHRTNICLHKHVSIGSGCFYVIICMYLQKMYISSYLSVI
jgi:hypothetical protein